MNRPASAVHERPARGADLLVRALQRAGVRRVFSLSGNHVMAVFDALHGSGIELVHVRHEAAAVHMADAWARLTGELGVALVTGGPGHANALGALYTAAMAESPVLLLSGHAPRSQHGLGAFQEMPQAQAAAPLCKPGGAHTCERIEDLGRDVARAASLAHSGRAGPVHLSLPSDLLEAHLPQDDLTAAGDAVVPPTAAFAPSSHPLGRTEAAAVVAALRDARRPLVLAGPWASHVAAAPTCAALQAALQAPVVTLESPRGRADPAHGDLAAVLAAADTVLLLGKRMDFTLGFGRAGTFAPGARFVQVDPEAAEIERTRRAVGPRLLQAFVADALGAAEALRASASAQGAVAAARPPDPSAGDASRPVSWLHEVSLALAWRPAEWARAPATEASGPPPRLHPLQALLPLQAWLDRHPRSVLVSDGGEFGQWAQAVLRAPRRLINGVAGAIGAALPYAIAARLAEPEAPVLAVTGDGAFGFHVAEVDTALRYGAPVLVVVGNDARWNAEHQIQLREYGATRAHGCELRPTRYDQVVAAFGGHGECVTEAAQWPAALQRAQAAMAVGQPACINVMIEGWPAPALRRPETPRLA